jgi:regulator of replication initiation timing
MDEKRIFDKLEKIEDHIGKQEVNLGRLTVSVEEHVKRSNLLEENITILRSELEPVKASVNKIDGAIKFVLLVVIPLVAAVITTMHFMK